MRFLPAGSRALLVEVADQAAVAALHAEVQRRCEEGWSPELVDIIPGARTLLLDGVADPAATARHIRGWRITPVAVDAGDALEIKCVYDGPDLAAVARMWDVSPEAAVAHHRELVHVVAFCGFNPGFSYLSGLDEAHAVPRRESPRPRVPGGSVALAGPYTGIYPRDSPGGWQLIGSTDADLWDIAREPPALLAPGRRVRFIDIT